MDEGREGGREGQRKEGMKVYSFSLNRKCGNEMTTPNKYESEDEFQAQFKIPVSGNRILGWEPALKAFHRQRVVERIGVVILLLQKELVDGQGADRSPGVFHVLKGWLGDGDGELDKLGPGQGWGWRLVLKGGGGQRGQGLRPWEIG